MLSRGLQALDPRHPHIQGLLEKEELFDNAAAKFQASKVMA